MTYMDVGIAGAILIPPICSRFTADALLAYPPYGPQASLVILAAQLMYSIDHCTGMRRVDARMYTMPQVEHVA